MNRVLDLAVAEAIAEIFSEVIVAPEFTPEALGVLQQKKNLRLLKVLKSPLSAPGWEVRGVGVGGFLCQERDLRTSTLAELKFVTKRQPTEAERQGMIFGWRVAKHVKSNAIVYASADRTLGIGARQMCRVDARLLAVWKAGEAGL